MNALLNQAAAEKRLALALESLAESRKQHEIDIRLLSEMNMKLDKCYGLINHLANIILDTKGSRDNDRYEAEQAIELVMPSTGRIRKP